MTPRTLVCPIAGLLCIVSVAMAQSNKIVVPAGLEDVEGSSVGNPNTPYPSVPQNPTPEGFRIQELYLATDFSHTEPGPLVIAGLAWRPDVSVDEPVFAEYDYDVWLGTTPVDSLSQIRGDNHGADAPTSVFSGTIILATDGVPRSGGLPHDFDYVFEFDRPYVYDPAEGNLLVEMASSLDQVDVPIWRDFHTTSPSQIRMRFFANHIDPDVAAGQATKVTVTQFMLDLACDFDRDGACDTTDINQLMNEIAAETHGATFDLNGDGAVNNGDRDEWLAQASIENGWAEPLLVGDSNLDGTVNANDLNALALNWLHAANEWTAGNFTGADVDAVDLNALALNWQQSISMATFASAAVPEPSALLLTFVGLALVWRAFNCTCR